MTCPKILVLFVVIASALQSSLSQAAYTEYCDYAQAQATLHDCSTVESDPTHWGTCYTPYSFTQKFSSATFDGINWNVINETGCNWSYCDGSGGQPVVLDTMTCNFLTDAAPTSNRQAGPSQSCEQSSGSIIDLTTASLGEKIPIVGVPFALYYSTDRLIENTGNYALNIPIFDTTSDTTITQIDVTVTIAGRVWTHTYFPGAGQNFNFTWDGLDSSGNKVNGPQNADVLYYVTNLDPTHSHPLDFTVRVGNYRTDVFGLGEWAPTILNFYSAATSKMYFGAGGDEDVVAQQLSPSEQIVVSNDGTQVFSFDASGRQIFTKSAETGSIIYTFAYDSSGRLSSISDAYGKQTIFQRNGSGVLTSIVAPYGQTTAMVIDSNNRLQAVTDPLSHTYHMTYNTTGFLASFQKPTGMTSNFTYDSLGHLYQDSGPNGFLKQITSTMGINSTVNMTTATGLTTQVNTSYDITNNAISRQTSDPIDFSTYSNNLLTQTETASNHVEGSTTNYGADVRFGMAVKNPISGNMGEGNNLFTFSHSQSVDWGSSGPATPFTFNSVTDQYVDNAHTYTSVFTKSTLQTVETSPVGRTRHATQDTYGKPTSVQWASYSPTSFSYDVDGRLQTVAQSTRSTVYAYGTDGLLASVTNPASQTTSMAYDGAGRLSSMTLPDSRVISYSYDSSGNITGVTPPSSLLHSLSYDGSELLSQYTPPALGGVASPIQYLYDADRNISQITRSDGQVLAFSYTQGLVTQIAAGALNYSYDYTYGQLSDAHTPDGIASSFGYNGRFLAGYNTSNNGTALGGISLTYNNDFLVSNSTVSPGSGSTTNSINFGYDNDNLLTTAGNETLTRSSTTGQITATTLDKIKDVLTYDSTYGELASYTANYNPSGTTLTPILSESYTRDALGRLSANSQTIGGTTTAYGYTYDSAGRLTAVTHGGSSYSSYVYDSNSNRTSGNQGGTSFTATYDAQDRLSTYNTKTYYYNANGERTSVVNTSPAGTTSYTYDSFGNLKTATLPSGSVITYTLDGLFRRISKKVGTTVKAYWVYDGNRLVAELNSSRVITKRFIYSSKSNVPDYAVISGTRYRIISDSIGSVRLVVKSADGTIAQRIDYDEFGRVLNNTSVGFQPFGYAGMQLDDDLGIYHAANRDYDPEVGRWLTKDPILFAGGDTNLYGYVTNDPINGIDPSGLKTFPIFGGNSGSQGAAAGATIGAILTKNPLGAAAGAALGGALGALGNRMGGSVQTSIDTLTGATLGAAIGGGLGSLGGAPLGGALLGGAAGAAYCSGKNPADMTNDLFTPLQNSN